MLEIKVPISSEGWDEKNECFVDPEVKVLRLEHSLVSLSKWESKWCTPFLSKQNKTDEETLDYIKCMTLTQNVDSSVYEHLTRENIEDILKYIDSPMTATTFSNNQKTGGSREVVTSELIYYWMITWGIPFECQKWHLNKLLTLIRVCGIKNNPGKKMSLGDILRQQHDLNAQRLKAMNTRG